MPHDFERVWKFEQKRIKKLKPLGIGILLFLIIIAGNFAYSYLEGEISTLFFENTYNDSSSNEYENDDECNVIAMNLHGSLYSYIPEMSTDDFFEDEDVVASENIMSIISGAEYDDSIKGFIIEVDSPGGTPVAGEEVANSIKRSAKPVVVYVRQRGTSAAYWAASPADRIFASKNSDVGGIGVTMSYTSEAEKNKKEGIIYNQLSSGKYKDLGSPDKTLTQEERVLIERDLNIVHENFVQEVALNRKLPVEKVRIIADGSTFLGEQAKAFGLIDEIGGYFEARDYLSDVIGEDAKVCWE